MSARNFQRIENGEAKTLDASILIGIAETLEVELSALFEKPGIRVDANNGVLRGDSMVITNAGAEYLKFFEQFAQQQQFLIQSFLEWITKLKKDE